MLSRWSLLIFGLVGQRSSLFWYVGEGGHKCFTKITCSYIHVHVSLCKSCHGFSNEAICLRNLVRCNILVMLYTYRISNEFSFHTTYYETSCVFYIPEHLASGYKTHNEFHNTSYGMKIHLRFFLAHLSQRLKWAIVIERRPSVVVGVVRPSSSVNFTHFRLLLQNRLMDFDETW